MQLCRRRNIAAHSRDVVVERSNRNTHLVVLVPVPVPGVPMAARAMRPLSGPSPCTASMPADRSSPHARAVVGLGDAAPREEGSDVGEAGLGGQAVPRPT